MSNEQGKEKEEKLEMNKKQRRAALGFFLSSFFSLLLLACDLPNPFFVYVVYIEGVPESGTVGVPLALNGKVAPSFATYKNIEWSLVYAETEETSLSGNVLNASTVGTVVVRATVKNGMYEGYDFTQDFAILFSPPLHAKPPVITAQPQDAIRAVSTTGKHTLTVSAESQDGGTLSYQWYVNTSPSADGSTPVGGDSPSYDAPKSQIGFYYYHVVVTNTNNSATETKTATATSNVAALIIMSTSFPIPITDAAGLAAIKDNLSGSYYLDADINLSTYGNWMPLGNSGSQFTGTLDGKGYTISNLTINNPSTDYQGLFGYIGTGGTVKNVGIVGGSVSGKNYVGGLAGCNDGGILENCYTTCNVSGEYIGGLVGEILTGGVVKNCYTTGNVSGSNYIGGITGYNVGIIENCYATGNIIGSSASSYSGGLVGYNPSPIAKVTNSVALNPSVTGGNTNDGRVSGSTSGTFTNNQARNDMAVNSGTVSGSATDKNGADVLTNNTVPLSSVFSGWNTTIWNIPNNNLVANGALPTLIGLGAQNPKLPAPPPPVAINNAAGLEKIKNNLNGNYKLTADIDMSGVTWTPIGSSSEYFYGTFDGGGYAIKNLTTTSSAGLFTYIGNTALITNVNMVNVSVTNNGGAAGGIVQDNKGGTIQYCTVSGTVQSNSNTSNGTAGGITASNSANGKVQYCFSTANVSGYEAVGGVAGGNWSIVSNCYSTGNVTSTIYHSGGVVGYNDNGATVENCYATGEMNFNINNYSPSSSSSGGIAWNNSSSTTKNCVALCNKITVKATNNGRVVGGTGTMQNNYARADMLITGNLVSGNSASNANGEDITSAQWHSAAWWNGTALFSTDVWDIANGRLPTLKGFPTVTQNPTVVP